jgi:hypothetical protein
LLPLLPFQDGRHVFVSRKALSEGAKKLIAIKEPQLDDLEFVLNFQMFEAAKTGVNIGRWLVESHKDKGLLPDFLQHHSTDGASNATSSVKEYALQTQAFTESNITHSKCHAHQCNRSAKWASGTGDFTKNVNPELSNVINKVHAIVGRVHRNPQHLKVLEKVQREKNRYVWSSLYCLSQIFLLTLFSSFICIISNRTKIRHPKPGVLTRWNSELDEVTSVNMFMGDLNKALSIMLGEKGCDASLLTENQGDDGDEVDKKDFMFTASDQMILRQYECGAEPVLFLSKFFQDGKATSHEILFQLRSRIEQMRSQKFVMYSDISHSDLEEHGKRSKAETVLHDNLVDYDEIGRTQPMCLCIEQFRKHFADDLERRCGFVELNDKDQWDDTVKLPVDIAVACLLNPLYGGK